MNRAERREKHICVECNDPATKTQRCDACAEVNRLRGRPTWNAYAATRRASKVIRGECFDCKAPAKHGHRRCADHLRCAVTKQTGRRKENRRPPVVAVEIPGLCACGNPSMTGQKICWCCSQEAEKAA